jgi:cytoskeletal protein CcmA (bactofilin family)
MARNESYITQISPATRIVGQVTVENDIRIAGIIEGSLVATGDLVLEPSGSVVGDLEVRAAVIAGKVKGNVVASGRVVLESQARLVGDLTATELVINEGARFRGRCEMDIDGDSTSNKSGKTLKQSALPVAAKTDESPAA